MSLPDPPPICVGEGVGEGVMVAVGRGVCVAVGSGVNVKVDVGTGVVGAAQEARLMLAAARMRMSSCLFMTCLREAAHRSRDAKTSYFLLDHYHARVTP